MTGRVPAGAPAAGTEDTAETIAARLPCRRVTSVMLLAADGVRRLVVVPLSFVSDHIETLYELDQLYAGLARRHGITHYYRARAFNGDPEFPKVLRSILGEALS